MKTKYYSGDLFVQPETEFESEVISKFRNGTMFVKCGLTPAEVKGILIRCKSIDGEEAWSIVKSAARHNIKESPGTASNSGSYEMPADIKEKFTEFVANQKDIPPEFAEIVNEHFWDLI